MKIILSRRAFFLASSGSSSGLGTACGTTFVVFVEDHIGGKVLLIKNIKLNSTIANNTDPITGFRLKWDTTIPFQSIKDIIN
jgi:hypothetical protein